ncbi:MAG TPA: hypothetical protein DEP43_01635 [Ruminococcaceae bacterium]|nr:hypothetical protein [Oscillospiraceae bacterium]HCB64659.1 hypothetical protein [Oscillospiraceae bacterium]
MTGNCIVLFPVNPPSFIIISSFFICPQARCLRFFLPEIPRSPRGFPHIKGCFCGKKQPFFDFYDDLRGKIF